MKHSWTVVHLRCKHAGHTVIQFVSAHFELFVLPVLCLYTVCHRKTDKRVGGRKVSQTDRDKEVVRRVERQVETDRKDVRQTGGQGGRETATV